MKVQITLKDMNSLNVIYNGPADVELIPNGRKITFKDNTYEYTWNVYEKGMVVRSHSQIDVNLTFKEQTKTKGRIDSEFGRMDVHTQTQRYYQDETRVEIKYDLIQDQESQPFRFILEIEQEILHEIH